MESAFKYILWYFSRSNCDILGLHLKIFIQLIFVWFLSSDLFFIKNAMAIATSTAKIFSKGKKWRIFSIKSIIKHKTSIDWIHLPWRTNRFWFFNSLDFLFAAVYVDLITKTSRYLWHFHYYLKHRYDVSHYSVNHASLRRPHCIPFRANLFHVVRISLCCEYECKLLV